MKKVSFFILAIIMFASCQTYQPTTTQTTATNNYTKQDLTKCDLLKKGMTSAEVLNIMGYPIQKEFILDVEEWHYCATGTGGDFFAALYLYKDTLVGMQKYVATAVDEHNLTGTCENFIKRGTYRRPTEIYDLLKK